MKIIANEDNRFVKFLGVQHRTDNKPLKLSQFAITAKTDEGLLMYNTLSCEMILLEGNEIANCMGLPYCYDRWFVVPADFNDMQLVNDYRRLRLLFDTHSAATSSYTIMTTTDCNARCFYCYELGRSRIMMTEETALQTAKYIIDNYRKLGESEKKPVRLSWFGGEPLYNSNVIDIICRRLTEAEVPYKSTMISNAYLFDDDMMDRAVKRWNLKWIQITLDGTEEVYNRSKAFIYKGVNAYERVINNIGMLLALGVKVTVRLNIDMHNASDLMDLAHKLKDLFGKFYGFNCYAHTLFEAASPNGKMRTEERRKLVYEKQQQLSNLLSELNISVNPKLPNDIRNCSCMADSGNSVVIAPTGDVGLCEHYSENEFFSNIFTPCNKDEKTVARFKERCEDFDLCNDCPVYPQCIRLKMCEEGRDCFPEKRQEKIDNMERAMRIKYSRWKTKQDEAEEEDATEEC